MTSGTYLLEFRVSESMLSNPVEGPTTHQHVENHLVNYGFENKHKFTEDLGPGQGFMSILFTQNKSTATIRGFPNGLITVDIQQFLTDKEDKVLTKDAIDELNTKIGKTLGSKIRTSLQINRGLPYACYFPTTDEKLIEYDFTECVYEEESPFQNIKIMKSPQFGNMLILDNDPNLAESDIAYTRAITGKGKENYEGKTVLILGGGDGGILNELRKENPKFITMVEIDQLVIDGAKKHLRDICADSLDSLTGDNYEVLVEDCIPVLKKFGQENKFFDFVINDLTAIPVTTEPMGEMWEFMRLILDLSMKVLSPTGKYYTQGNGANMKKSLAMYEEQLGLLKEPVEFKKETVCVPSYHELWVFYEMWKKQPIKTNGHQDTCS